MLKKLFLRYMGYQTFWVPDRREPKHGDIVRYEDTLYQVVGVYAMLRKLDDDSPFKNAWLSECQPVRQAYMSKYTYERIYGSGQ